KYTTLDRVDKTHEYAIPLPHIGQHSPNPLRYSARRQQFVRCNMAKTTNESERGAVVAFLNQVCLAISTRILMGTKDVASVKPAAIFVSDLGDTAEVNQ